MVWAFLSGIIVGVAIAALVVWWITKDPPNFLPW